MGLAVEGRGCHFNRVLSVNLKEKLTFGEGFKRLRKLASWMSRGRTSNRGWEQP